jgi:uncharacterized protein YeaC (DUF1315 family)
MTRDNGSTEEQHVMSTDTNANTRKKRKHRNVSGQSVFMTKSQLAFAMGEVDTQTVDQWIARGTVPPPHSRPGSNTALWLREHFDHYVETGRWPKEAFRGAGE